MRKLILALALVASLSGCASNGYYPGTYRTYGGGSSTASTASSGDGTPPGYHYSDPSVCSSERGLCPLLIGGALVGLAAVLAAH